MLRKIISIGNLFSVCAFTIVFMSTEVSDYYLQTLSTKDTYQDLVDPIVNGFYSDDDHYHENYKKAEMMQRLLITGKSNVFNCQWPC